jgi:hypothetical protein
MKGPKEKINLINPFKPFRIMFAVLALTNIKERMF